MAKKRMVLEMGMGVDIRGGDMTKAAKRAVSDALRRNSLTMAQALGFPKQAMMVEITVGLSDPEAVDVAAVVAEAPYGQVTARAVKGGLSVAREDGETGPTVATAAIEVFFDMEPAP